MSFDLDRWVALHVRTLADLWTRWQNDQSVEDELTKKERRVVRTTLGSKPKHTWTVKTEVELVRLLGALQFLNPNFVLWFRGEGRDYPLARPSRVRNPTSSPTTKEAMLWFENNAWRSKALRDRGSLARAALLQHYGCATSFLDVTHSYEVACAFAFENPDAEAHLRVYALPRHTKAVTLFDDADVVLVDLRAEMPSYCLRPHIQQGGFIARRSGAYRDIADVTLPTEEDAELDALCIGHIKLDLPNGSARFSGPRGGSLYPKASMHCAALCDGKTVSDLNGDFILHLLECMAKQVGKKGLLNFPDTLWTTNPRKTA